MYNHCCIIYSDIYFKVKCQCRAMNAFLRNQVKRHPADILGISKSDYKMLLNSPTPSFYRSLYSIYNEIYKDYCVAIYSEFKECIQDALPRPYRAKKRKIK